MKIDLENKEALIDTNILVYCYAEESPKKRGAVELVEKCFMGELTLCISLQNIGEFCSVSKKKYSLETAKLSKIVNALLLSKNFKKLHYSERTFGKALLLAEKANISFWDALIAATMLENGIREIYTEDDAFKRIEGIKAVNIF